MKRVSIILNRIFPVLFVTLGLGALGAGLWMATQTLSFIYTATRADGKVVALDAHRSRAGGGTGRRRRRTYRPVFEFTDTRGAVHRVTESFGSRPSMFDRGEKVTVLYYPAEPENARIHAISTLWFGPGLATVFGTGFTVAGCCILNSKRGRSRTH